jgi:hypothetical protein
MHVLGQSRIGLLGGLKGLIDHLLRIFLLSKSLVGCF